MHINLITVVGPRAEPHSAVLLVEWKELDIHRTGALVDGGRFPVNETVRMYRRLCHQCHLVVAIRTIHQNHTVYGLDRSVDHSPAYSLYSNTSVAAVMLSIFLISKNSRFFLRVLTKG